MKILVFGGSGFIGQHLSRRLQDDGEVIAFDRKPSPGTRFVGDIKDPEAVSEAMVSCDRWINLAGLLGTSELIDRAQDAVDTNITGALNIFTAAMREGKPGLQIAVGNHWMNNPYSITKSTAERLAIMYARERGADIRIVRAMNVFGPGQKAGPVRKLMPNVILPALRNDTITIYGTGEQIMDMIYVDDAVEILARVLMLDKSAIEPGEIIEAGAGAITVNEIADLVCGIVFGGRIKRVPMRAGEDHEAVVKISARGAERLYELTGFFVPADCTPIHRALRETIDWYRANG